MLTKICAYCGAIISKDESSMPGCDLVSHGLCATCEALTDIERDKIAIDKAKERAKGRIR